MRIDAISVGKNPPDDVNVIVEVPVGGHPIKYEMDKDAGALIVDRFLGLRPGEGCAPPATAWVAPSPKCR